MAPPQVDLVYDDDDRREFYPGYVPGVQLVVFRACVRANSGERLSLAVTSSTFVRVEKLQFKPQMPRLSAFPARRLCERLHGNVPFLLSASLRQVYGVHLRMLGDQVEGQMHCQVDDGTDSAELRISRFDHIALALTMTESEVVQVQYVNILRHCVRHRASSRPESARGPSVRKSPQRGSSGVF